MRLKKVVRRNPLVMGLAVAALAVLLFISEGSYFRAAHTLDALREMAQARTSLQSLERGFIDAEAAQRGFLLTGRSEYLQPYDRGRVAAHRGGVRLPRRLLRGRGRIAVAQLRRCARPPTRACPNWR